MSANEELEDAESPYNNGYTHEAMHTTWVLLNTFDKHVLDTRCAEEFPDVAEAAERAHQALFDLYQLIGSKFE
jgi:hypothetical protein